MTVWRSRDLGDVTIFVHGLPVLIHFTLFQQNGFFTDRTLGTPLALGLNMGHWITSLGEDNPYVSLVSDSRLINVARPPGMNHQDAVLHEPIERIREETVPRRTAPLHRPMEEMERPKTEAWEGLNSSGRKK